MPEESLEFESISSADIGSIFKEHIKRNKAYHLDLFNTIDDSLYIVFDSDSIDIFHQFQKKERTVKFTENPYGTAMSIVEKYLEIDGTEKITSFINNKKLENKKLEKERFEKWKKQYTPTNKKERKANIKRTIIILVTIGVLFLFGKLIWDDELRFIGRKTDVKKGVITKIGLKHAQGGGYYQRVTYEFIFNGKKYINYFTANKFTGVQYENDTILVKFELNNSKYISNQ